MTTERPRRNDLLLFVSTAGIANEGRLQELAIDPAVLKYVDGWHAPNSTLVQTGIVGLRRVLRRNSPDTQHQRVAVSLDGDPLACEDDSFRDAIMNIAQGLEPRAILLSAGPHWRDAARIEADLAKAMRGNAPRLHTRADDGHDPWHFRAFDGSAPESVTTGVWPDLLDPSERNRMSSTSDSGGPMLLSQILERRANGDTRLLVLHARVLVGRSPEEIERTLRHCRMQIDEARRLAPSKRG